MPAKLADALLAVLSRARAVTAAEADAIARLAAPADAVAEVQLDPPHGAVAAVIGFAASGTRSLLAELIDASVAKTATGSTTRARTTASSGASSTATIASWLDAVASTASHWGVKLGPSHDVAARDRFAPSSIAALGASHQVYARGRFEPSQVAALGAGSSTEELASMLALIGVDHFSMIGVDLVGGAIARHVGYAAVTRWRAAFALGSARGVPVDSAPMSRDPEWLHLSWDLATSRGPFKIDSGPRQAAEAIAIAGRIGLDGAALVARLATLGLGDPSHVGLRVGVEPTRALTLYFQITAS